LIVNEHRIKERFGELVKLNSPSRREGAVASWLHSEFSRLGLEVQEDGSAEATGSETGNLIVRIPGSGPKLLFGAHMDVVEDMAQAKISFKDGSFRTDGSTILGADDKAGIVAIVEAVTVLVEEGLSHRPLELVFTTCEEIGLLGSKALAPAELQAQYGFIFDSGKPTAHIIISAPSQDEHFFKVTGKAAHAGTDPEKGISAIAIAARAIDRMPLGRLSSATTANIGKIQGGSATNIVPEQVELWGEARSFHEEELEAQSRLMADCFTRAAAELGGKAECKQSRAFTGFSLTPKDPVVCLALEAVHKIGQEPQVVSSGGGSDANVLNLLGIPTVNLGVGMDGAHTKQETVALSDLVTAANLALALATGDNR
jgi:tripeptide aminopeptidase